MVEADFNDPKFWKWSVFYYNPHDKNRWVPRREGLGLCPNYAHKDIYLILGGTLLILLIFILFFGIY